MKVILYRLREAFRRSRSQLVSLILCLRLYKKKNLPAFNRQILENKWKYVDPCCVFDTNNKLMTKPKVALSIIIPLYNSVQYLPRLVNMLMSQRTAYRYEVIFVNDGSKDETESMLETLIKNDWRFQYIKQENGGISKARNVGLDSASGKYLSFIDHDDEISLDFVQKIINVAEEREAQIVKCAYCQKYGETKIMAGISRGYVWGGVFRRELFQKVRFPVGYWYEDMINNFILRPQAKKVEEIDEVLYFKNSTPNNASKKIWRADNYKCIEHIYLVESLARDYRKLGFVDKNFLFERLLQECSSLAVERTKHLDLETREQVFLMCCELVMNNSFDTSILSLSKKQLLFYNAFRDKDYRAWELATLLY